jgi:hypothetical protein
MSRFVRCPYRLSGLLALLLALILAPASAAACAIDNVASLLANDVPAMLTTAAPHGDDAWAPFTVAQALATGAPVRLTEAPSEPARTLPPATRATPFRWVFGDGAMALGHAVAHRYARPGLYHLLVSGYDRGARRWFIFDSALLRVVPADQILRANLGYEALRAVIVLSSLTWPVDAALVLAVLVLLRRKLGAAHGHTGRRV